MINLGKFQGKGLTREIIVIHTSEHSESGQGLPAKTCSDDQSENNSKCHIFPPAVYGKSFWEIVRSISEHANTLQ
jgi:hypothetical protein